MRVLAVTYGGGHAKMVAPVLRELARRRETVCQVLALTTARATMEAQGFASFGFLELVREGDTRALEIGAQMAADHPPHPDIDPAETVAYLGLSYHDLEERLGGEARLRLAREGRQAFLPLTVLERAFDRVRPDLVIATNSPRAEEAAIRVARLRGVPAVCMVDLFGGFDVPRVREPDYADRVCVLAERTKRTFVDAGRDPDAIVVTGNPAFDVLADPAHREAAAQWRERHGWTDRRVVLWVSQQEPSDPNLPRRIDRALSACVARRSDWVLAIRPHPSEAYLPDAAFGPGAYVSRQTDPLPATLLGSDVVVVISSTVGIEAALLDRPVVTLDVPITVETAPYLEMGLAIGAADLDALDEPLEEAMRQGRNLCTDLPPVGEAAGRVAEVCLELVG